MTRSHTSLTSAVLTASAFAGSPSVHAACEGQPQNPHFKNIAQSPVITAIEFNHQSHRREAAGSDNWPVTWAADGHLYATWGDGGGFGGSNQKGRVSFGTARIEGNSDNYTGVNVHGGFQGLNPGQKNGYSWGLISVDGTLYMWAGKSRSELFYSENLGATWRSAGWAFGDHDGPFSIATVLNFGKDYADSRDEYVYVYAPSAYSGWPSQSDGVDLARVHKDKIKEREAYEFYAGMSDGSPLWNTDIERRKPIFEAKGLIHWTVNVDYISGIDRYLLSFTSNGFRQTSNLIIMDSPTPWGPWTVAANSADLCRYDYTYAYHFPRKWQSDDGTSFTMIFSGGGKSDSWNTIDGKIKLDASRQP